MNGKQAKMLRSINRADKGSKRQFNALDHKTKGIMRRNVEQFIAGQERLGNHNTQAATTEGAE